MILILAGTQDGRELAAELTALGYQVCISVTTEYGRSLAAPAAELVNDLPLDATALRAFIAKHQIKLLIDASHPYARGASENALHVTAALNLPYIRYERQSSQFPAYEKLHVVDTIQAACQVANNIPGTVFLTTGSRALAEFKANLASDKRVIARILPDAKVLAEVLALGFSPKDIIAMQGPFSEAMNSTMFADFATQIMIMKESGKIGGSDEKFLAAQRLNLDIIIIKRPKLEYRVLVHDFTELLKKIKEVL